MELKIPVDEHYLWRFEEGNGGEERQYVKTYHQRLPKHLKYHIHDFYEINIVFEGKGRHCIDGRLIPIEIGDVFVIPPNIAHGYIAEENLNVYHILLSDRFMFEFSKYLEQIPGYKTLFDIEPRLRGKVDNLFYIKHNSKSFSQLKDEISKIDSEKNSEIEKVMHILSLVAGFIKKMGSIKSLENLQIDNERILTILESADFIEKNYSVKIDFKSLASKCAFSYCSFLRMFKRITGQTPSEYLNNVRIKRACYLLKNTNESILSIALGCGFFDSSHFIKAFCGKMNMSPLSFRKK